MPYTINKIKNSNSPTNQSSSVLIIYTGGTLGMVKDKKTNTLVPYDFAEILANIPEIERLDIEISNLSLPKTIDSANMQPAVWIELAQIIKTNFNNFDGFVIIHGTDTMAYTASALSFLLENLSKPVIFTGAQLPIGVPRTDARENLITSLEIAATKIDGRPVVPEVAIYFNSSLFRGNRSKKVESEQFDAFRSENYPELAIAGVTIDFNHSLIKPYRPDMPLKVHEKLDEHVMILKLFPGISQKMVNNLLNIPELKGVVMETYGAGNAPTEEWFRGELREAINKNIIIINVSQCFGGRVTQTTYDTGKQLQEIGIVSGSDITTEAAITKLMYLLAKEKNIEKIKYLMEQPLVGELSLD